MRRLLVVLAVVSFLVAYRQARAAIVVDSVEQFATAEASHTDEAGDNDSDTADNSTLPPSDIAVAAITSLSSAASGQDITNYVPAAETLELEVLMTSSVAIDASVPFGATASGFTESFFDFYFTLDDTTGYELTFDLLGDASILIENLDDNSEILFEDTGADSIIGTLDTGSYLLAAFTAADNNTPGATVSSQAEFSFTLGNASNDLVPEPSSYIVFGGLLLCFAAALRRQHRKR